MFFEDFVSGTWIQQYQYKSFSPTILNQEWQWRDPQINTLLERAARSLAELNAFSQMVPDVDLFIRMHIAKEANTSSRIEGTQTQMDEALMRREQIAPEKRDDWQEVQNYIQAINEAIAELDRLPLSNRLLNTLYLVSKGLLNKPALYLSDFFERNRGAYYDALTVVRSSNNLIHWVKFFLTAVIETASKGKQTFIEIMKLRDDVESKILIFGRRAENAKALLLHLYQRPLISVNEAADILSISHQSASNLIKQMEEHGILRETTGYQRNRMYLFSRYFHLFME
jgi:Fic family protein